jgi:8-oxo-dGTP pyrophosphatase MutT (NUDIX family)
MSMGHDIVPDHLVTTEEADKMIASVVGRVGRPSGKLSRLLEGWWRRRLPVAIAPARRYVLGFVFDHDYHHVLLIEKRRPEWMMGRLNGLGGKIAEGESPAEAMERELREETAGRLGTVEVSSFGRLRGRDALGVDWEIWLFHGIYWHEFPADLGNVDVGEGTTFVADRQDLPNWSVLPNLRYLVPMAVNHARGIDAAAFFEIFEVGVPPEVSG